MANDPEIGRLADREGFVLWIERQAGNPPGALRGVLERSATSERVAFESGEGLLALLRGGATKRADQKEKKR